MRRRRRWSAARRALRWLEALHDGGERESSGGPHRRQKLTVKAWSCLGGDSSSSTVSLERGGGVLGSKLEAVEDR
jgi:hypothetical protein